MNTVNRSKSFLIMIMLGYCGATFAIETESTTEITTDSMTISSVSEGRMSVSQNKDDEEKQTQIHRLALKIKDEQSKYQQSQAHQTKELQMNGINSPDLKTRESRIQAHQQGRVEVNPRIDDKTHKTLQKAPQNSYVGYRDFAIYSASSRLFVDDDQDGFYQTFSVTFDADVYGLTVNEPANVFAELYLSRNGGPWEHYYTTDIFTIYGQSDDDDFEVLTTLASGYKTDHYDVLIDLYEYGYPEIVATLSADETDDLYALPLESQDRDEVYEYVEEVVVVEAGGGMSRLMLLCLVSMTFLRSHKMRSKLMYKFKHA